MERDSPEWHFYPCLSTGDRLKGALIYSGEHAKAWTTYSCFLVFTGM
jgi:hypothetical protein